MRTTTAYKLAVMAAFVLGCLYWTTFFWLNRVELLSDADRMEQQANRLRLQADSIARESGKVNEELAKRITSDSTTYASYKGALQIQLNNKIQHYENQHYFIDTSSLLQFEGTFSVRELLSDSNLALHRRKGS